MVRTLTVLRRRGNAEPHAGRPSNSCRGPTTALWAPGAVRPEAGRRVQNLQGGAVRTPMSKTRVVPALWVLLALVAACNLDSLFGGSGSGGGGGGTGGGG